VKSIKGVGSGSGRGALDDSLPGMVNGGPLGGGSISFQTSLRSFMDLMAIAIGLDRPDLIGEKCFPGQYAENSTHAVWANEISGK
jgi:hypothetical protein